jgi:hypothetical protein
MDLYINGSNILNGIISEVMEKTLPEEDVKRITEALRLENAKTSTLVRTINTILAKAGYAVKAKDVLSRLIDALSDRVDIRTAPEEIDLTKEDIQNISIDVMNRFDQPVVFEVSIEDRDNFLPLLYDKSEDAYFNKVQSEGIIDSGSINKFRFKIGKNLQDKVDSTTLFVVVRSREIEGLNSIRKLKVHLKEGSR